MKMSRRRMGDLQKGTWQQRLGAFRGTQELDARISSVRRAAPRSQLESSKSLIRKAHGRVGSAVRGFSNCPIRALGGAVHEGRTRGWGRIGRILMLRPDRSEEPTSELQSPYV